jgi:hypothetical protein
VNTNINISSSTATVASFTNVRSTVITVSSHYFSADTTYGVSVYICNFIGACTISSVAFFVSAVINSPLAIISGPQLRLYARSAPLSFEVQFLFNSNPSCGYPPDYFLSYSYQWFLLKDGFEDMVHLSVAKSTDQYYLPSYSLEAGTSYSIKLLIFDSKTSSTATDVKQFIVQKEKLVSVISGGTLQKLNPVLISYYDGSSSYDNDIPIESFNRTHGLQFYWYCQQVSPLFSSVCPLIFEDNSAQKVVVKPGSLVSGIRIQLYLTISKDTRIDTSSVTLEADYSTTPTISLDLPQTASSRVTGNLKLCGKISWSPNFQWSSTSLSWSVSPIADLSSVALSPIHLDTLSGNVYSNAMGFNYSVTNLVVLIKILPAQTSYTFTLTLYSGDSSAIASNSISVIGNLAPIPGSLASSPTTGFEGITLYTLTASLWDDENLPLMYRYLFISYSNSAIPINDFTFAETVFF